MLMDFFIYKLRSILNKICEFLCKFMLSAELNISNFVFPCCFISTQYFSNTYSLTYISLRLYFYKRKKKTLSIFSNSRHSKVTLGVFVVEDFLYEIIFRIVGGLPGTFNAKLTSLTQ